MAEQGHWYPRAVAFAIGAALSVCVLYALSAAGAIPRLPLTGVALCLLIAALLVRAVVFPWSACSMSDPAGKPKATDVWRILAIAVILLPRPDMACLHGQLGLVVGPPNRAPVALHVPGKDE